jgi:hypothetical protein
MGNCWKPETAPTGGSSEPRRTPLPVGHQYLPNDNGRQAKLRRLIQRTRNLQPTIEQTFRINVWLQTSPEMQAPGLDRDRARLIVLHHALCSSEDLGLPFHDTLDALLDKLECEQSTTIIQELAS